MSVSREKIPEIPFFPLLIMHGVAKQAVAAMSCRVVGGLAPPRGHAVNAPLFRTAFHHERRASLPLEEDSRVAFPSCSD